MQGRSIGSKRFNVGEAAPQPTRASIYQEENTPLDWTAAHDLRAQLALPQRPAELHPRALRHGLIASQLGLPMLARAETKQALDEWVESAAESVAPAHAAYSGDGLDWSNNEQTTRYDEWELQKELVTYEETYPGYDTYDEHPRLDFQLPPVAAGYEAERDQRHELDYAQAAYAPAEYGEHDEDQASSPGSYPYADSAQPSAARWHSEQPIRRVPERSGAAPVSRTHAGVTPRTAEPRTATHGSFANPAPHSQARVAPALNTAQHGAAEPRTKQAHARFAAHAPQGSAHRHASGTPSHAQLATHSPQLNTPSHRGSAAQTHATTNATSAQHGFATRTHTPQTHAAPSATTTHHGFAARAQHAGQTHAAHNTATTHAGFAARAQHAGQTHAAHNTATTHAGFAARAQHAGQTHAAHNAATTHAGFAARAQHVGQAHAAPNAATTHAGFAARAQHAGQAHAAPNAATTHAGSAARAQHAGQAHAAPNAATTHAGFAARAQHAGQTHAAHNTATTHAGFAARAQHAGQAHAAPNAATTHAGFAARAQHAGQTHAAHNTATTHAGSAARAQHAGQTHAAHNTATTHAGFAARAQHAGQTHAAPNAATTHAGFAARAQDARLYAGVAGAGVQVRQSVQRAVRRYVDDEEVVYPRGGSWLKRFVVLLVLAGAGYAGQHYYFNYYQRAPAPLPAPPPPPPPAAAAAPAEPPPPPAPIEPSETQAAPASPESAKERRSAARAALIAERWRERHAGRRGRDDDPSDDRDDSTTRSRAYARASDERASSSARSPASASASQRDDYTGSEASRSERSRSSTSANDDYVSDRHAAAQSGTLRINSLPWSQVHIDGQLVGHTPQMNLLLPAGKHRVTLVNSEMQLTKSLTVQITPGNITTHTINLAE